MRIIAGQFRSRKIISPRDLSTRPIADRVKEALFNHLRGHVEDMIFIDFFAGTGTIGLEAISRGAKQVQFVEYDRETVSRLQENIDTFDVDDLCIVTSMDALGPACLVQSPTPVHIATFDPPYPLLKDDAGIEQIVTQMERVAEIMDDDGFLILRTEWPFFDRELPTSSKLLGPETHTYKTMALHFYQRDTEANESDSAI